MEARSNPSWSESAHGVEYEQFKYWLLTLYSLAPYMSCIKRCMLLTQTAKIVRFGYSLLHFSYHLLWLSHWFLDDST